jgi:hypothetical protein
MPAAVDMFRLRTLPLDGNAHEMLGQGQNLAGQASGLRAEHDGVSGLEGETVGRGAAAGAGKHQAGGSRLA